MSKYNIYFKKMPMRVMRQEWKKIQKSEKKEKNTEVPKRYVTIFSLFVSYFSSSSSSSSLFHCMAEARERFGSGVVLKTTR